MAGPTTDRHTITTCLWLTGATAVKHFSRFDVFLGCPLYHKRWLLWGAIIRHAAQFVPEDEVIRVLFDDTTKKKAGRHIEGLDRYRNGAGTARQEYRTLRGLNFVLGLMRIPLKRWPAHHLRVPIGLELYLKPEQAQKLGAPYRSRSQLARDILDFAAEQLPERRLRSLADGDYSTKESVRELPDSAHAVGRFPISAKLYDLPPTPDPKRRGAPRKKGDWIGSPKTLAETHEGWSPPRRSRRRDPSLVRTLALGVAGASHPHGGAQAGSHRLKEKTGTEKTASRHRRLVLPRSVLERR